MEHQRQILRLGAVVIALAAAIRLVSAGFFTPVVTFFQKPQVVSFLMYMQTGYVLRAAQPPAPPLQQPPHQEAQPVTEPESESPLFSNQDLAGIQVQYHCDYRPDLESLLMQPAPWELTGDGPTVLIVHTHATETYADVVADDAGAYRTLQAQKNMISVGQEIARVLENGGITVLHDTTLHDYPDYNNSYAEARTTIERYLAQYPSIRMVLDIHRDASDAEGGQLTTSAMAGGQKSAQLMMVVGTDAGGNYHPHWQENLSLALKLTALLERTNPGISRPIDLRTERFNMDLTPGSLLVEVGAAGNSHGEALIAANALAQSILMLADGEK